MVSPALQRGEKGFHKFITESRRDGARTLFMQEPLASEGITSRSSNPIGALRMCMPTIRPCSVVVRATQVIPALRADQLAVVAGEPLPAIGANLAGMLHRLRGGLRVGAIGLAITEINRKIGIEGARPLRQHAPEISIRGEHSAPLHPHRRLMHQFPRVCCEL